jgi:hypothetical protein
MSARRSGAQAGIVHYEQPGVDELINLFAHV